MNKTGLLLIHGFFEQHIETTSANLLTDTRKLVTVAALHLDENQTSNRNDGGTE